MDIDITNVGDKWNKKHKVGSPWTKNELKIASLYAKHSKALFAKANETDLSQNAANLIHHLLLKHPNQKAITYMAFYSIEYLKDKPFPFGPNLRRELEDKGFIKSHENIGAVGDNPYPVGDICEFIFITEAFPCE